MFNQTNPEPGDGDNPHERGKMQMGDWFNAAVNALIGTYLGVSIVQLVQLMTTDLWPVAILIPILVGGILLFHGLIDGLFEKIFPSGIRPARKSVARRLRPLPRLLSLPVGIILGVTLVWLGLDAWLPGLNW